MSANRRERRRGYHSQDFKSKFSSKSSETSLLQGTLFPESSAPPASLTSPRQHGLALLASARLRAPSHTSYLH